MGGTGATPSSEAASAGRRQRHDMGPDGSQDGFDQAALTLPSQDRCPIVLGTLQMHYCNPCPEELISQALIW